MSDKKATTRSGILAAATHLFVAQGYAGTSLREIGRLADVDAALLIHYFGSKEALFLAAMASIETVGPLVEGPVETLGERFVRFILDSDDRVRSLFLVQLRASDSDGVNERLRQEHETAFVQPLKERLTGDDVDLRSRLAAALIGGLLYALWVVQDENLLATDHEEIVKRYGALMQALIDADA